MNLVVLRRIVLEASTAYRKAEDVETNFVLSETTFNPPRLAHNSFTIFAALRVRVKQK